MLIRDGLDLLIYLIFVILATLGKNLFMAHTNNKSADQPVHVHSLISAFVRCLNSTLPIEAISKISKQFESYRVANIWRQNILMTGTIWATSWENLFLPYANNKGTDQPVHPCSLISTFVVRCLDSIIPLVSLSKISSLLLVSVAEQTGLSLTWSETPKTGFLAMWLIMNTISLILG